MLVTLHLKWALTEKALRISNKCFHFYQRNYIYIYIYIKSLLQTQRKKSEHYKGRSHQMISNFMRLNFWLVFFLLLWEFFQTSVIRLVFHWSYKCYNTFAIHSSPLMMAKDWVESTREIINYKILIKQFPLDIIKLIRQLVRINKKLCRQKNAYNVQSNIYIYIYKNYVLFIFFFFHFKRIIRSICFHIRFFFISLLCFFIVLRC